MNMCLALDAFEAERARQALEDMPSVYMEGDSDSEDSSDSDEGAVHPITLCLLCKADQLSGREHWFERMCLHCRSGFLSLPQLQREQQRLVRDARRTSRWHADQLRSGAADKAAWLIQRWWLMWRWKKWLPERRRYRKWLLETFEYLEPDL